MSQIYVLGFASQASRNRVVDTQFGVDLSIKYYATFQVWVIGTTPKCRGLRPKPGGKGRPRVSGRGGIWGTVQKSLTAAAAASEHDHNSEWVYWRELILPGMIRGILIIFICFERILSGMRLCW